MGGSGWDSGAGVERDISEKGERIFSPPTAGGWDVECEGKSPPR